MIGIGLAEAGYLPDWMIRRGIRWMLRDRLRGLEQPDPEAADRLELLHEFCALEFPEFVVSAEHGNGLEELRDAVYQAMDVVRVYTKLPNHKQPDYDRPLTIHRGGTLTEIAELIHKDFAANLKHARVWGSHVHDGTAVKGDYVLHDKDIVELHV